MSAKETPASADADRDLLARAAISVGTAQRALVLARRRAGSRLIGGRPLIELQSTGHRLAHLAARLAVARASVLAAGREVETGTLADHRTPAIAAAAAEVAFACAWALVQVYGAAGTSDPGATDAFQACQSAAAACGPPAELWLRAGRLRGPGASAGGPSSRTDELRRAQ